MEILLKGTYVKTLLKIEFLKILVDRLLWGNLMVIFEEILL